MILLRELQEKDVDSLARFSTIPGFINLSTDKDILREKVLRSSSSFRDDIVNKSESKFIFVAEDLDSGTVLGTSMIASQHGTVESPHFYFEVSSEKKVSTTMNTGFIHGTLKLKYDTNGPSELGGLVVDPKSRNSEERLGRQISFVRFLFLGLNRIRFKKHLLAELLPPLNKKGQSPLWEAIGRRFTNMDYWEADELCQKNKEFILSLFPTGKIYTTFFSAEARNAIGKVGKETEPVFHMLQKIGFHYKNQVDPFDGGPHIWARVDELLPIRKMTKAVLAPEEGFFPDAHLEQGLICLTQQKLGEFRAVAASVKVLEGKLQIEGPKRDQIKSILGIKTGDFLTFMPYY